MRRLSIAAVAGLLSLTGCRETTAPRASTSLTASQAAAINARLVQAAGGNSELSWLADSVNLVLREGTVAVQADLDTDFADGPFYGVALHRAVSVSVTPFSTFHAILFDDPSNPTRFIVVSGWAQGQTPPTGAGASIELPAASASANAHFFSVEGPTVRHWRAIAGHLAFNVNVREGSCSAFAPTPTVSCAPAEMRVAGTVTNSQWEPGMVAAQPTLTLRASDFMGIRLAFQ